ncbi:MAG: hypothetical protein KJ926_07440, partial [Candidatus Omnitrophica bacterium]|nr:hypothetical protein [Candidatus Omnitrophota bacterium]
MSGKIKLILAPNYWLHGDAMRGLPYGILPYGVAILKGSLIRGGYAADLCNLIMYMQRLFETRNRFSRLLRGKSYKYRLIRYYLGDNDRAVEKLVDHLLDSIYPDNSRIFGISVSSESCFLPALVLAKRLKERYKAKIVLGGPLINLYSQPIVTKYKYIDYVLRGRCEEPILKLLDYEKGNIGIKEVPNLETVYNNELLINEIKDYRLEDEGLPDYDGFDFEPYYINKEKKQFIIPYRCASGCLGKCIFCLHRVSDKKEYKSLDKVINEIRFLKEKHNTGYFFIT